MVQFQPVYASSKKNYISTMKQAITFLKEVRHELTKVTWPKREEVVKLTLLVIVISLIVGVYVGGLDVIFTKLLEVVVAR